MPPLAFATGQYQTIIPNNAGRIVSSRTTLVSVTATPTGRSLPTRQATAEYRPPHTVIVFRIVGHSRYHYAINITVRRVIRSVMNTRTSVAASHWSSSVNSHYATVKLNKVNRNIGCLGNNTRRLLNTVSFRIVTTIGCIEAIITLPHNSHVFMTHENIAAQL